LLGIAGLYLMMGDFNRSSAVIDTGKLKKLDNGSIHEWGIAYPLAYREQVTGKASEFKIPENIIYSIMRAESNYLPTAVSPAGAVGLMQVMPATAAAIARPKEGAGIRELLSRPEMNIDLGVKHLKHLLELYDGDHVMAVAAYNAGAGNVNRWVKRLGRPPRDVFIENIPFAETRDYVKKVLAGVEIYKRLYRVAPAGPPERPAEPAGALSGGRGSPGLTSSRQYNREP
jgi:soluble lytic murein transglycosylase